MSGTRPPLTITTTFEILDENGRVVARVPMRQHATRIDITEALAAAIARNNEGC